MNGGRGVVERAAPWLIGSFGGDKGFVMRELDELLELGGMMEAQPELLVSAATMLRVRDREGVERPLRANAVQRAFEREAEYRA
jgi:hypothetical protein